MERNQGRKKEMSSELDKQANRFRELFGKPFTKIPQELIRLEREVELINEEIDDEKALKAPQLVLDQLSAQKLMTLRNIDTIKKKLKRV